MCDFLTGPEHKDRKKITELETALNAERHACDAIFSVLSSGDKQQAMSLYSQVLLARTKSNYEGIIDLAHVILGET